MLLGASVLPQLVASPAVAPECPAGFSCYADGPSFAKALGDSSGGAAAPASAQARAAVPRCEPLHDQQYAVGLH